MQTTAEPPFVPLVHETLDAAEQQRRADAFRARLAFRRTVRHFSDRPVARELIETIVATAATAPSGANQQPWRFMIVSNPEIKRQIRAAAEAEEHENYDRRFPETWKQHLEPFGTDWHKEFLETAPYLIVVFRVDGTGGEKHYYVHESVGIASGLLIAAIHIAGLVTVTHTPNPMGFLNRILDRPSNEKPYLLLPVGYPAPGAEVPNIRRKPFDEIATFVE